jgi:hypothetical protein
MNNNEQVHLERSLYTETKLILSSRTYLPREPYGQFNERSFLVTFDIL